MTFPKDRWSEIDRIFDAALDEPEEERERFVRTAAGDDPEIEREVRKLLALAEPSEADELEASPEMKGILFEEVALALDSGYRELGPGDRLGPYEVVELLGRGGMGAVYRAKDPALERDVAIKALTRDFSADMSSLRRFEREAKVLASLNHPNIAAIFDLLKIDGRRYLVLELVEGETLQERLERGGPIPVPELIRIALEIASALEEAHGKGVVHRDLKPSNVKLGRDGKGRVKILDFGLAKPFEEESTESSERPTTRTGAVLGTPGYMSPEQARGQTVDKRADIWAFGSLLYEMTTGQRAFAGATVSDAIAAVLRDEADLGRLPLGTPPELVRLIKRCLKQDPRERLQDIGDARIELSELESRGTSERRGEAELVWRSSGAFLVVAVLLAFLAGMSFLRFLGGPGGAPDGALVRASINIGPEVRLWQGASSSFTLSPDGRRLAFVGQDQGRIHLYVRELDSYEVSLLRNSEGARDPFFSPDGSSLGFFAAGEIRKVSLARGVAERLSAASVQSRGASWNEDGTIVFAEEATPGLFTIDAQGGERRLIAEPEKGSATEFLWPQWIRGSGAVLFTIRASEGSGLSDRLAVLDTEDGEIVTLVEGSQGFYTGTGHLVYRREGALEAVPFDMKTLSAEGPSVRVVESIQGYPRGASAFSISSSGNLIYMAPTVVTTLDRVVASGEATSLVTPSGTPGWPRVSPDGRYAAVHVGGPETRDVWILDLQRPGSMRQLTYRGGGFPVWSADGTEIVFMSRRDGSGDLFKVVADGSGRPEPLLRTPRTKIPVSWSPRGVLAYYEIEETTQRDIWLLDPQVGEEPVAFAATPANELSPVFSPDGRFIAYVSNESGQNEVYVRPYPPPSPVTAVSIDGGSEPVWSRDGRFLYYRHRDSIMAVQVSERARFEVGQPREVLATSMVSAAGGNPSYDVIADSVGAEAFLLLRPASGVSTDSLDLVLGWYAELRALAPRPR